MATASPHVKAALQAYADTLKASYSALGVSASAEEQLKAPTKTLLETCAELAPKTVKTRPARVVALLETSVKGTGRPDVGVTLDGLLNGYVELKAPNKPADPTKFRDKHDKEQWKKFQLFPNVIYTNGQEWRLYRYDGEKPVLTASVKLGDYSTGGASAVTDDEAAKFSAFLQTFYTWKVITPTTPQGLAELLAPLAKLFRQEVAEALKVKDSKIENVRDIWKSTLFPRATDEQFADIYAQTVTYALLLAKLDGANVLDSVSAVKTLKKGHELLSSALKILTDDDLKEELGSGLETLLRVINDLDAKVFKAQEEKLWLYFYEYFLEAYDRELRNKYGVYYTPTQVIGAQVRLVDEVLKTRLGKAQGFADKSVLLLDPAAGTGAYPLAVIQHALGEAESYGAGMVAQVATDLASTTHAFEILVGPYAVSHLRISQAVQNAGGTLPADGAHVYLNDTLESPHATNPAGLPFMLHALTDEHKRAQKVKLETPIMVTLGNPPYDRHDAKDTTRGGWVRHKQDSTGGILEDFLKPVREAGEGGHIKNLYNDYVYFWRWALWKTFENPGTDEQPQPVPRPGIVCFITAASYLRGPGFIGMREMMRRTFSELWILDLEGDNLGARKTENVFAIQTPVCIALGVKLEGNDPNTPATVRYAKITGTREEKLAKLDSTTKLADVEWRETMSGWDEPFLPTGDGDYWKWPKLTDMFPWQHSGIELKRTWPIGETKEVLERRWDEFFNAPLSRKIKLFKETPDRRVAHEYKYLNDKDRKMPSLSRERKLPHIGRIGFRSFDRQYMYHDLRFASRFRPELWKANGSEQIFLTSLLTGIIGDGPATTVTHLIPDRHYFRGSFGGKDVIPLYLDAEGTKPNVTPGLLDVVAAQYGAAVSGEDLFAYAYALLSTPAYVETHSEDLTVPGPRLPITKDAALFAEGAKLGREMLNLHTYGERFAAAGSAGAYRGKARNTKAVPTTADKYPDDYFYNLVTQTLTVGEGEFSPVLLEVYNYSVSGLEVLKSWIKYRLKRGYGKKSSPLDDLRPEVWTAEMTRELLELIWLLERTLEVEPTHTDLLKRVEAGDCFKADELPRPAAQASEEDEEPEGNGMETLEAQMGVEE